MIDDLNDDDDFYCNLGGKTNIWENVGYVGIREPDGIIWIRTYHYGLWTVLPGVPRPGRTYVGEMNWRYGGSGPRQLAWNILVHATHNEDVAQRLYHSFTRKVVAKLHRRRWHLSQQFVLRWVRNTLNQQGDLCQMRGNGRVEVV